MKSLRRGSLPRIAPAQCSIAVVFLTALCSCSGEPETAPLWPPRIRVPTVVEEIDLGSEHACARFSDGSVQCWGDNACDQVGAEDPGGGLPKQPLLVPSVSHVAQVSLVSLQSCVLFDDGTGACWGCNDFGSLGNGDPALGGIEPHPIAGLTDIVQLASGLSALRADGTVWSWGSFGTQVAPWTATPTQVEGIDNAIGLARYGFECALLEDKTVTCRGANSYGQLGDGTTVNRITPAPVVDLANVTQIAVGGTHACALIDDGTVRCWGHNFAGALGNGTKDDSAVPVPVYDLGDVRSIDLGPMHSCAVLNDGGARCWGANSAGQLGDGTNMSRLTPTPVVRLTSVRSIAAAFGFTCALLEDRSVMCWGENAAGQLGNGTFDGSLVPTPVVWREPEKP